ncbi:MAG TPA: hypothetical protein VGM39_22010 [Kofleriaceae bacterium]|jgi:hypothetical protein
MKWLVLVLLAACGGSDDAPAADASACPRPSGDKSTVGDITGADSTELSGLAASHTIENLLWTLGDAGNPATLWGIGSTTGASHGALKIKGADNVDWEDLSVAPCPAGSASCIYISDLGDNALARTDYALYIIPEPSSLVGDKDSDAATKHTIAYPDGSHDVEAIFVDSRDHAVYAIEKVMANQARVYHLVLDGTAEQIGQLTLSDSDPRVTAADIFVDACNARLAIRTHSALHELRSTADASIASLLTSPLASLPVADEDQGESVAYAADGASYFTTSEGKNPPLHAVK